MKSFTDWLVFGILAAGVVLRLSAYGDLGLSVAHTDTHAYIESAEVDLFSWKAFTSDMPFTTNLVYKIFKPESGYQLGRVSSIATGTISRRIRPGFSGIARMQSLLSLAAWVLLAWICSTRMKSTPAKVLTAAILVLFGFTPQVSDWDSVLGTESLSISLYILALACLIHLAFSFAESTGHLYAKIFAFILFLCALFLWTFVRDVNPYALIFLPILLLGLYLIPKYRLHREILVAGLFVLALFTVAVIALRQRPPVSRTLNVIWEIDLKPFPARAEFFYERGMPAEDSPEFPGWFRERFDYTYMLFLFSHPGYTFTNYFEDMNYAFQENIQPYFIVRGLASRSALVMLGNYLHPESPATFLIICVLFIALNGLAWNKKQTNSGVWLWLCSWIFLTAGACLFFSIFGVPLGLHRHALSATASFRLLMWMLMLIMIDHSFARLKQDTPSDELVERTTMPQHPEKSS